MEAAAQPIPTTLDALLAAPDVDATRLATHLDALPPDERIHQCQALGKAAQRRLWDAAAAGEPLTIDFFVPAGTPAGTTVRFAGRNSLPMFTLFEKRFARAGDSIIGFNFQTMSFVTGPGYFTLRPAGDTAPKEVLFDYTAVPPPESAPAGWPPVRSNAAGLSRLVYNNLHDYNRRVSRDVVIGSATRLGKPMDSYYVLVRIPDVTAATAQ
jgi:hypothetical protein